MRVQIVSALATSTLREVSRNPAVLVVVVGAATLLCVIALVAAALTGSGEEFASSEAAITTLSLVAAVFAGVVGIRSASPDDPLGPTLEARLAVRDALRLRLGRWTGAVVVTTCVVAACIALGGAGAAVLGVDAPGWGVAAWTCAEGASMAGLFAGVGLVLRSWTSEQLAYVGLVVALVALRVLTPGLGHELGWWSAFLPDAARGAHLAGLFVDDAPALVAIAALGGPALQGFALALLPSIQTDD